MTVLVASAESIWLRRAVVVADGIRRRRRCNLWPARLERTFTGASSLEDASGVDRRRPARVSGLATPRHFVRKHRRQRPPPASRPTDRRGDGLLIRPRDALHSSNRPMVSDSSESSASRTTKTACACSRTRLNRPTIPDVPLAPAPSPPVGARRGHGLDRRLQPRARQRLVRRYYRAAAADVEVPANSATRSAPTGRWPAAKPPSSALSAMTLIVRGIPPDARASAPRPGA